MKRLIGLISMMLPFASHATIVVRGNDTAAPFGFKTAVQSQTYDPRSGIFYVGLSSGTDTYTISQATRPSFTTLASFTPVLAANSILTSASIEALAFSPQTTTRQVLIGVEQQGINLFAATQIFGLFTDGSQEQLTPSINDAAGLPTSGIVGIAASATNAFVGVKPHSSSSNWGDLESGIAMVGIGATNTTLSLVTKNAPLGIDGNLAIELDHTSAVLGTDVMISNTHAVLIWDDPMQRLFIGMAIQSSSGFAKSIVVGYLDLGALDLEEIAPDGAITGGIGEIAVNQTTASNFNIENLAVMHATTGPDYLIINDQTIGNRIFAAPLVNDITNPTSPTNGTFAKYTSNLDSNHKFTVPASSHGDLVFNDATTCPEAVVGAGNLPIDTDDHISDFVVVDDGVYVSIGDNNGADLSDSDRGIFYSQAMFDNTGKIIRWTPWTKRVVPFNAFPNITLAGGSIHNGAISFLQVDGQTGNVWFVEETTGRTVGITSWTTGDTTNGLLQTLGSKMSNGIYKILDLDQATRGFLGSTVYRYALFGGVNKVAFAVTSIAFDSTDASSDQTYCSSPQTTITDFSSSSNFLISNLPDGAGSCLVLEYSRTSTIADSNPNNTHLNYFFAGTDTGLFVFNVMGAGFNATDLQTLNSSPFSTGSWLQVDSISGQIIDIKTSGSNGTLVNGVGTLYVVANQSTPTIPLQSTLYAIPFASTVSAMFAPSNIRILAQTGVGTFTNLFRFYGVQIIATGDPRSSDPGAKEQLILTTNQGLFVSQAAQGVGSDGTITAANQTAANWQIVQDSSGSPTTAKTLFNGVAGPNTPVRQTAWPFNLTSLSNFNIFNYGTINQLSGVGSGSSALFNTPFLPLNFNANSTLPSLQTLDRIVNFYSDGGRRFFTFNRAQDPATQLKLAVLPYNVNVWNCVQPQILTYPPLSNINRFYGLQTVGATGILIAGTESGAVGLD